MQKIDLETEEQFREIIQRSEVRPYLIFKHSTRCSISSTVLNRLERSWGNEEDLPVFCYLDVLARRPLSDRIAEFFHVSHETPQVLLIQKGMCTYHTSHMNINYADIKHAAEESPMLEQNQLRSQM